MESSVRRGRGRPRKKRREDKREGKGGGGVGGSESGKRVVEVEVKGAEVEDYVGRYVLKEFEAEGVFLGKVVYCDSGLYRVEYEDGDCEDFEVNEVKEVVLEDDKFDADLKRRKKRLDRLVSKNKVKRDQAAKNEGKGKDVEKVEFSALSEVSGGGVGGNEGSQGDGNKNRESSGVPCDGDGERNGNKGGDVDVDADREGDADGDGDGNADRDRDGDGVADRDGDEDGEAETPLPHVEAEIPLPPPPELPPSSGTIGVPEECVMLLFSVYGFLRSFSIQLFLCPFGLDDFVGSLKCCVPNTLLDAVHVSLMRALRKHLESLSSDCSVNASKCLRCVDWSLLDNLTWPIFLIRYLTIMGYLRGPDWSGFSNNLLDRDYYQLPIGRKLSILQILCDDVLDSSEVRSEIDMREELEVGTDSDAAEGNPSDHRPRRVHPRYSKTSACKDEEAMEIITRSHDIDPHAMCAGGNLNVVSNEDENSDECRLCGMDGTLLCCDGCPSAYHSRCIGVSKKSLPEGPWYCPECSMNKVVSPITRGTSLAGAVIFGTDPYGQVFLGTCGHLLVCDVPSNTGLHVRYYNYRDILRVLQILSSSVQSRSFYLGICTEILQHWDIPKSIFPTPETSDVNNIISCLKDNVNGFSSTLFLCGSNNGINANEVEPNSVVTENSIDNMLAPCTDTCGNKTIQTNISGQQSHMQDCLITGGKIHEQIKMESTLNTGSDSLQANQFDATHQILAENCSLMDSGDVNGSFSGQFQYRYLSADMSSQMTAAGSGRDEKYLGDGLMYMGTSFKPQAYFNNYMHGEFAASAAAKFAILSEESKISEARASGSSKKTKSSSILLQIKAFSLTASRFFWPSSEKKLVEVPRERCGWCHSCKAPPQSQRGCMLNNAASNAIRSATKILPGLRHVMDGGGSLPSIATYILYMEECLRGLVVGPFRSARYRNQWRSQVEKARAYKALKVLLVQLEENIRLIALSGDWVKLEDDWFTETSMTRSSICPVGTAQTRGPGRKRKRKQSFAFEVADDSEERNFTWWHGGKLFKQLFQKVSLPQLTIKRMARHAGWRRISGISYADGCDVPRRSRRLVWRAAVDSSRNAAQLALQVRYLDLHVRWTDLICLEQNFQDGKGQETDASVFRNAKIFDKRTVEDKILYGVAFENQKHLPSRVMKNIIDIEKSQDREKYWFSETQIPLYLIKEFEGSIDEVAPPPFKNTTSNLSELQRRQLKASRKDVFTYLVRKRDKLEMCSCASCQLDVLLGKAVKCSDCEGYCHEVCTIQSVFSQPEKVQISVICKQCCHTKSSTHCQHLNSNVYSATPMPVQVKEHNNLASAKRAKSKGYNQPVAGVRSQESSSEKRDVSSGPKLGSKSRSKIQTWGIIWKKKDDTGMDFRLKNILPKGNGNIHGEPVCALCLKPYNSDLTYIFCETCKNWYHAEAVELEESRISDVVGFKCCKCRRIKSPICPYEEPESKRRRKRALNPESNPTESDSGIISESKEYEATTPVFPTQDDFVQDDPLLSLSIGELVPEQTSNMDFDWDAGSGPGPQKLPVRRHSKVDNCSSSWNEVSHVDPTVYVDSSGPLNSMDSTYILQSDWNAVDGLDGPQKLPIRKLGNNGDLDGSSMNEVSNTDSLVLQNDVMMNQAENLPSPHAEWDASANGLGDEVVFDYENYNYDNMEFEPQTYFSFTELLASDAGGQFDGADSQCAENMENVPSSIYSDMATEQGGNGPPNFGEPAGYIVQCRMCSQTEPVPDLFCYQCGLWLHSYCSPWEESSSREDGWICGNCQEQE